MKIPTYEQENEQLIHKLLIGNIFLYGNRMIEQKEIKEVGQQISYYRVVDKKDNRIEYTTVFDKLEEG
jgi:hypothetical protein